MVERVKVGIVDDSLFVRTILSDMLSSDRDLEIVGTAKDGIDAVELAKSTKVDVFTMDLVMPKSDGLDALSKLMKLKNPPTVIMLSAADRASADAVMKSLELGAFDFVMKPASNSSTDITKLKWELISKIKAAFKTGGKRVVEEDIPKAPKIKLDEEFHPSGKIIGIGSSTGGPVVLRHIILSMPHDLPAPIVVAQHMPKAFTESFSERLAKKSRIGVSEARDGEVLKDGWAYIAPGDRHMEIENQKGTFVVKLTEGARIRGGRPSADLLLTSVANAARHHAIGVILTGMGGDGAKGMRLIKDFGGSTIAQDEETSLVWSMPHTAIKLGAIDQILPIKDIPAAIVRAVGVGA